MHNAKMESLPLTIRKAEMKDAEWIAAANRRMALETERKTLDPETALRGVKALFKDGHKGFYLVAETGGRIVGQLMITTEWSDWRNLNFWWIQSVYVEPDFRGRKVFSCLFRHVEELARSRREVAGLRLYVERHNRPAKETYEALGMAPTIYDMYEVTF